MRDNQDRRMRELVYRLIEMAPEAPPFQEAHMVQLKSDPTPARPTRRRTPVFVASLGAALVIGITVPVLLLLGDSTAPPATQPTTLVPPAANGWIAFTVWDDEDHDIWLVSLDEEPRRVIGTETDRVHELCPAFSPDGRSLAYGRVEGYFGGSLPVAFRSAALVIADVSDDGRASDRLSVDLGDGLPPPCPIWSPDGARVAFGVPRTPPFHPERTAAGSEVWIVRLADQDVTILPDLLATDLDWSPDGSLLAIVSGSDDLVPGRALADRRIHLYELATGNVRVLDDTLGVYQLTWSPDGRFIAYSAGTETFEVNELRLIDLETGHQQVVDPGYRVNHGIGPVWSPDGNTIAYQRLECENHQTDDCLARERHEVVLVTPGDAPDAVTRTVVIAPFPVTGTPLVYPFWVTWSPDGDYLLYIAWDDDYDDIIRDETAPVLSEPDLLLVAVPVDRVAPPVILHRGVIIPYDGYPDTSFVPIQTWGYRPSG